MCTAYLCPGPADLGRDALLLGGNCLFTRSSQCSTRCENAGEPLSSTLSAPRACGSGESRLLSLRVIRYGLVTRSRSFSHDLLLQSRTIWHPAQRYYHMSWVCLCLLGSFAARLSIVCVCRALIAELRHLKRHRTYSRHPSPKRNYKLSDITLLIELLTHYRKEAFCDALFWAV